MRFSPILIFYIFLLYPIFGYLTITFFGLNPFYILSILIIIFFISKIFQNGRIVYPNYLKFYTIYLALVIVSKYFINQFIFKLDTNLYQVVFIFSTLCLYLLIENLIISTKLIDQSKIIIKYLIIIAASVSLIQYFIPTFFLNTEVYSGVDILTEGFQRRIPSIFTWGDINASRYLSIGFMIFYGIVYVEYKKSKFYSITIPILAGFVAFTSQFRIAILTYLITTLTLVVRRISIKSIFFVVFFLVSFYVLLDIIKFDFWYFVDNRLKSDSAFTRVEAFKAFAYAFPQSPYFGTGGERSEALFEGFGRVARLHNLYLGTAYYYGIFALIAYLLFVISISFKVYKTGVLKSYWPPFIGIICYISATMTMPAGEFFEPGLAFMMVYNKYYYDKRNTILTIHT